MIHRLLKIGSWDVNFLFFLDKYDIDYVLPFLVDNGATKEIVEDVYELMADGKINTGFTFTHNFEHYAVVCVGPCSSGKEFIDTLVHEIHHLAVAIAESLGVDLEGEVPAYISGDLARDFADVICKMGCDMAQDII